MSEDRVIDPGREPAPPAPEGRLRWTLPVSGMLCASCVARVEKALARVEGVESASVNLAAGTATVTVDPQQVGPWRLVAAIRDTGYDVPVVRTTFPVQGMSCASCVGRVERALRGVPGVLAATVNLAAQTGSVDFLPGVASVASLRAAVEGAGYAVPRMEPGEDPVELQARLQAMEERSLLSRFRVAVSLGVPLLLLSHWEMFPGHPGLPMSRSVALAIQFLLATPIQLYSASRFYRGAWSAARHGTTDMNTLVALGTSVAYIYSVAVTFSPGLLAAQGISAHAYFETAAAIVALVLLGR